MQALSLSYSPLCSSPGKHPLFQLAVILPVWPEHLHWICEVQSNRTGRASASFHSKRICSLESCLSFRFVYLVLRYLRFSVTLEILQ